MTGADSSEVAIPHPPRRGTATELELKYTVSDPRALAEWLAGPDLAAAGLEVGEERQLRINDRYLDTHDGRLGAGGYAARLRSDGDRIVVSVKARVSDGDTSAGRHLREELEGPATESRDPVDWPSSDARALVERLAGGLKLRERFRIRQRRRERTVTLQHGGAVAGRAVVSLQAVRVYRGRRLLGETDALEVELEEGSEEVLDTVAAVIRSSGSVAPETHSKEDFALGLLEAAPADTAGSTAAPGASVADDAAPGADTEASALEAAAVEAPGVPRIPVPRSPGMRASDPLADAGRKVLAMHLARMLAREAGTRAGDVEELHKMRVATRRMRATWRTFEGAYRPKRAKRYVRELKAVADRLGAVRDLDVQLEALDAHAAAVPRDAAALGPLREYWQGQRDPARDALIEALDSAAYVRFVDDYRAFVSNAGDGDMPVVAGAPSRVRDTAAGRVWLAYEQLRAHNDGLAWADVPALHAVRILGKRLRYALESFCEVLGPETKGVIARVTALQDHLGALNDADIAAHLVREYLVEHGGRLPAETVAAVGRYLTAQEREVQRRRRGVPAVWRQVMGATTRRALGRAVSGL